MIEDPARPRFERSASPGAQAAEEGVRPMRKEDGRVTVSPKEARQAELTGEHVRIILIVGLALAIIGMIVLLATWSQG
jgi:hypothetical protein